MTTIVPLRVVRDTRDTVADEALCLIEQLVDELVASGALTRATVRERLLARGRYIEADTFAPQIEPMRRDMLATLAERLRDG